MLEQVRFGMILPQTEIGPDPRVLSEFASTAESSGFEFLLVYDHVLGADRAGRPDWPGPYDVTHQFHEPFVLYGFLAACTTLELATGVLILPQRQTALVAKQAAEVDLLTNGRFRLGVGIGWNPVEYEALGVDFSTRAERYEEQIELLRLLWTEDVVSFEGRFDKVSSAGILPRPVQRPIPIWMGGGTSRPVLERIGRLADGWLTLSAPGHGVEEAWQVVRESAAASGRDLTAIGLQGRAEAREDPDGSRLRRQIERWRGFDATTHLAISGLNAGRGPRDHIEFVKRAGEAVFG
jgi:probable F420-dependent oxidoreductase